MKYVHAGGHSSGTKTSSFNLRLILWEAGITVSNKVLECLVLRFSKNRLLSSESYVTVMVRLHLAHGELMDLNCSNRKWSSYFTVFQFLATM